jgi:hypothetical protein
MLVKMRRCRARGNGTVLIREPAPRPLQRRVPFAAIGGFEVGPAGTVGTAMAPDPEALNGNRVGGRREWITSFERASMAGGLAQENT